LDELRSNGLFNRHSHPFSDGFCAVLIGLVAEGDLDDLPRYEKPAQRQASAARVERSGTRVGWKPVLGGVLGFVFV